MLTLLGGKIDVHSNKKRHCEVRSNPQEAEQLCKCLCIVWDCFVVPPRNDVFYYYAHRAFPPKRGSMIIPDI